jgi:hypothetical protein
MDALTIVQFAMGTMVMSSVLFVRAEDTAGIAPRYLMLALATRSIVCV